MRALLLLSLLALPQAAGFLVLPEGISVHDEITEKAAEPLGFPDAAIDRLQESVRAPDLEEIEFSLEEGHAGIVDGHGYRPAHHCDRLPGTSHEDAFASAVAYIHFERSQALQILRSGEADRAASALGRSLHALQDCHSHSDVVDQPPQVQAALQRALLEGGPLPDGVRIAAFNTADADAGRPQGDPYGHGDHNRDGGGMSPAADETLPDGRKRWEASRDLAVETTRVFLERFLENATAEERAALFDLRVDIIPKSVGVPGAAFPVALAAVAMAAARVRRA